MLHEVCPNCGDGLQPRPIRPRHDWKDDNHPGADPASTTVRHRPVDTGAHAELLLRIGKLPPESR